MAASAQELDRRALSLDLAAKAALIALLLFSVFSGLERFEGKAMTGRALTYPLAALVVPAVWWLVRRRRAATEYPYALDILLVLPFLIDVAGNALDLYDTVDWWDDANHFVNWGLLTAAFGQLLVRLPVGAVVAAGLALGFGAVTAVLWEFAEYWTFIRNSAELDTAYTDTLGDLALGLSGSAIAAVVTAWLISRQARGSGVPRPERRRA
jgi:hypothetical protein